MHEPHLEWSFRSDGENSSCLVANGGIAKGMRVSSSPTISGLVTT